MKIKRTTAPSVREAMNKVRQEQGPDAVILANRKVADGVEIISAIDYDEAAFDTPPESSLPESSLPESSRPGEPLSAPSDADVDKDPPTHLSYQAVARSQMAALANPMLSKSLLGDTRCPAPRKTSGATGSGGVARAGTDRAGTPAQTARPQSSRNSHSKTPRQAAPVDTAHTENIVDISAVPRTAPGAAADGQSQAQYQNQSQAQFQAQPPGYTPSVTDTSASWQQGQVIQDLQRELHSLHGLMQNQLSVLELDSLAKRSPVQFDLLSRLSEMGLGSDIARPLVTDSLASNDPEKTWRLALGRLASQIPIADDELLDNGGVAALVGPTGVGKTTSVAKLAARFVMRHGQHSVALISTDSYRIGAHEQLHNFARILGVPFKTANNQDEFSAALGGFFDKKLVLIDTAGMSQRDMRLNEQFSTLRDSFPIIRSYLVIAANTQLGALDESFKGFGRVDLNSCIVTKLDETTSIGAVLTVAIRHKLPIAYVGVGQRVPEDLQPARAHRLVSRAVPMAEHYGEKIDPDTLAVRYASGVAHARV